MSNIRMKIMVKNVEKICALAAALCTSSPVLALTSEQASRLVDAGFCVAAADFGNQMQAEAGAPQSFHDISLAAHYDIENIRDFSGAMDVYRDSYTSTIENLEKYEVERRPVATFSAILNCAKKYNVLM